MLRKRTFSWFVGGAALGILNALVFTHFWSDRPIGASTAYPYIVSQLLGMDNEYTRKIAKAGLWEVIFLLGGLVGAFLIAVVKKEFQFKAVSPFWRETRGGGVFKRIVYAFLGGFLLIWGARMAGGCTSGHILSGGMQLALSSILFGIVVIVSATLFGRWFYKGGKENG